MNLLDGIKKNNTSVSINVPKYYDTSYNSNLDVFTMITRFNYEPNIINLFNNALIENEELALANLLYILDIREGKGERRLFKIIYKFLCNEYPNQALRILPFISELGRYDYLLVGINTKIEKETIEAIKNQLNSDKTSDIPSLLAKWLPSIRTHKKNNLLAKKLVKLLNISEKELYNSGMNIGKDILSTTINTLFFAFLGGIIAFFFWHYSESFEYIINYKVLVQEIVELLCCCIGSILVIPITSYITSLNLIKTGSKVD